MTKIYKSRLDWVKSISNKELEKRFKDAKTLEETAKKKISFYEEELERRKKEVPLGVPAEGNFCVEFNYTVRDVCNKHSFEDSWYNIFNTVESAKKHAEMLYDWRKALVANSKGEQIDIKVLLPLLPKGWVACDSSGEWFVFSCKPFIRHKTGSKDEGVWDSERHVGFRGCIPFNIKPAENWEDSLMECGL